EHSVRTEFDQAPKRTLQTNHESPEPGVGDDQVRTAPQKKYRQSRFTSGLPQIPQVIDGCGFRIKIGGTAYPESRLRCQRFVRPQEGSGFHPVSNLVPPLW